MITKVVLNYRNCLECMQKVKYELKSCPLCGADFPADHTIQLEDMVTTCLRRMRVQKSLTGIAYSTFYHVGKKSWNRTYAIPFLSVNEVLVVENVMNFGPGREGMFIAGFNTSNAELTVNGVATMQLDSWYPIFWDAVQQVYYVGDDEGPRVITRSNTEKELAV